MNSILKRLFSQRTEFKADGLILDDVPDINRISKVPGKFCAPRKLDFRDMCIPTSDQARSPHCTGYATAGYIEVQNWRKLHYPEQVDGDKIYFQAKELDHYPADGTWIHIATKAALNLDLIDGQIEYIESNRRALQFAIHEYLVCIGSFEITDEWNAINRKGIIPNWGADKQSIGGHAVLICGYDPDGIYIQNSWSRSWGLYGFGFLSWEQFDRQFKYGLVFNS